MSDFAYLKTLNKGQYEAATTIHGPVRILAGAGSGKTHTLISRVAYMVDSGIPPEQILLLTFTNNAAKNMVKRAAALSNPACAKITACTYHSFCAKLLRVYSRYIGIPNNFSILAPTEAEDAMRLVKSDSMRYANVKDFPTVKKVIEIYSKSANMQMKVSSVVEFFYPQHKSVLRYVESLIEEYKSYKCQKNLLDYDDLLTKMLELLKNGKIRNRISDTYQYIMVDEYQDTNALQEKILFLIAGKYKNLAIVGDDYQSIYAFRGSDINNILEFPERFGGNCKTIIVNINYRSTEEILAVANHLMEEYATFGCKKTMVSNNKHGEKPYLYKPQDPDEESDYVMRHIERMIEDNVSLEDIAILERSSRASFSIENELNKREIPYRKLGGLKFMEFSCILDMLAFLKALTNDADELAFYRILDLMPRIGSVNANKVVKSLMEKGICEAALAEYKKKDFYGYLQQLLSVLDSVRDEESLECQYDMLCSYYFKIRTLKTDLMRTKNEDNRTLAYEKIDSDRKTLEILRDMVLSYDTIIEFLDDLVLDANKRADKEEKMITISTIHSAKGMEWSHVFMIQCVDQIFPKITKDMVEDFPELESEYLEELRCFYVAITRAKDFIYICSPEYVSTYGGRSIRGRVSHFLDHSMRDIQMDTMPDHNEDVTVKQEEDNSNFAKRDIYLAVPYSQKDEAKALGARWDWNERSWYIPAGCRNPLECFEKWMV